MISYAIIKHFIKDTTVGMKLGL